MYSTSLRFCHLIRSSKDNVSVTSDTLEERIKKKLGDLLQTPADEVDLNKPMNHYGVDSLMAVELVTWINEEFGFNVSQLEVLNGMTAALLVKRITQGLR